MINGLTGQPLSKFSPFVVPDIKYGGLKAGHQG